MLGSGPSSGRARGSLVVMSLYPSLAQDWGKHLLPMGFILIWLLSTSAHRLKPHVGLPACVAAVTLLVNSRSGSPAHSCLLGFALLHLFAGSWEKSPVLWLFFFLHTVLLFPMSGDAVALCHHTTHRDTELCHITGLAPAHSIIISRTVPL